MERINVIGTSCSGKSTLARTLSSALGIRYVEFDAIFWGPDWTPVPTPTFRKGLRAALAGEQWVADGGYASQRDITWARVDTIVWLDYPMPTVLARWARRTFERLRSQEEFWPGTGNRESVRNALRGGGLLWWIVRTHRDRRRRTLEQLAALENVRVIRLRSPSDAGHWLASVARTVKAAREPATRPSAE